MRPPSPSYTRRASRGLCVATTFSLSSQLTTAAADYRGSSFSHSLVGLFVSLLILKYIYSRKCKEDFPA